MVLLDCSLHESGNRRWIGLPSKPQLDKDGRHRVDERGKRLYSPCIEIPDRKTEERFQAAALVAVDRLLAEEEKRHQGVARRRPLGTPAVRPDSAPMPYDRVSDLWPR
jgi:hypothetical protein